MHASQKNKEKIVAALESELERRILEIWKGVLGVPEFGIDDSFVAFGGDSFSAIRLNQEIEICIGRRISVDVLLEADTVRRLVQFLEKNGKPIHTLALSAAKKQSFRLRPLFCIYGIYLYKHLADALGKRFPTYGIYIDAEIHGLETQSPQENLRSANEPVVRSLPSVEQLASLYIREMRAAQPEGPYQILGSSFGGVVAFEMANQLQAMGESVHLLAMLDSFAPGFRRPNTLSGWIREVRSRVRRARVLNAPLDVSSKADWDRQRQEIRIATHERYRPQHYAGDALLIRAEDKIPFPGYRVDPFYGWKSFVNGQLVVKDIPGDHIGILSPPNVSLLADALQQYLDLSDYRPDSQPQDENSSWFRAVSDQSSGAGRRKIAK